MKPLKPLVLAAALVLSACGGPMMNPGDAGHDAGIDAGSKAHLSGLPDCGTPSDAGTVADVFNTLTINYGCSAGGCHGGMPFFNFHLDNDAGSLRDAWVNVKSLQSPLNRVTPGDIDQSYVIYKLWGQQADAGADGFGDRMPQGAPPVTNADLCQVINWVNAGAP
jgi:hypothetical protein